VHIVLLAGVAVSARTVPSCPHLAPAAHHGLPSIDPAIRRPFLLAATESFVGWATSAIFVSLLPSFLIQSLNLHNLMVGAFVVTGLQTGMLSASFIGRGLASRAASSPPCSRSAAASGAARRGPVSRVRAHRAGTLIVGFGGGVAYLAGTYHHYRHRAARTSRETISRSWSRLSRVQHPALGVGIVANYVGLYTAIIGAASFSGGRRGHDALGDGP